MPGAAIRLCRMRRRFRSTASRGRRRSSGDASLALHSIPPRGRHHCALRLPVPLCEAARGGCSPHRFASLHSRFAHGSATPFDGSQRSPSLRCYAPFRCSPQSGRLLPLCSVSLHSRTWMIVIRSSMFSPARCEKCPYKCGKTAPVLPLLSCFCRTSAPHPRRGFRQKAPAANAACAA